MHGINRAGRNELPRPGSGLRRFLTGWMIFQLGCCLPLLALRPNARARQNRTKPSLSRHLLPMAMARYRNKKAESRVGEDFIIGPGDVLNILVWKEPDFSRSVPVRPDGKISLPLLNDVAVSGLTAMQLKEVITEKLKKFVGRANSDNYR